MKNKNNEPSRYTNKSRNFKHLYLICSDRSL